METTTLYALGESTIDFDPSVPCIILKHVGFLLSEEYRKFHDTGLELLQEKINMHKKLGCLIDKRSADAVMEEDLKWAAEDLTRRLWGEGLKHLAFVRTDDEYALANVANQLYQNMVESDENEDAIVIRNFAGVESAKAWLREVLNEEE